MKILITGATGFIGENLISSLVSDDLELFSIVRTSSNTSNLTDISTVFIYDGKIDSLISFFQKHSFNGVIHLASLFLPTHEENDISNLIDSNLKFGIELLEAVKRTNVQWFINTGTLWQHYENNIYNPVNLYAATKQGFETISKYYTETSNIIFTTLKLNDTFGKNDKRKKIFNLWDEMIKKGISLDMSLGEQIIDIVYIEDVISAYKLLIAHLSSDISNQFNNKSFCVTSRERMNLKDLAKLFESVTNKNLEINWGKKKYREREVMIPYETLPIVPGWSQKHSLKEAIKKCYG